MTEIVTGAVLAGTVRTAAGVPTDATVTVTDRFGTQVGRARSGPEGTFRFPGLAAEPHVVVAHRPGFRPAVASWPGAVALVLEPVAAVFGSVLDADNGGPVPAAAVVAVDGNGDVVARSMSDPDGRYRLEGLEPPVNVVAAVPGADPVAVHVAGVPTTPVDLAVRTRGELTGVVRRDGRPVVGVALLLLDATGTTVGTAVTDAEGRYRFPGVPTGPYTLRSATRAPRAAAVGTGTVERDLAG